jgi:hypothetical protein
MILSAGFWDLGCRVYDAGFRVQGGEFMGLGFRVQDSWFSECQGFAVWGFGLRVYGKG